MKFGGSLIDFSGANIPLVVKRISEMKESKHFGPLAVFSAPKGVTNQLQEIGKSKALGREYNLNSIFDSYMRLASTYVKNDLLREFRVELDRYRREVEETIQRVDKRFDGLIKARLLTSGGELVTAALMSYVLRSQDLECTHLEKKIWPIMTDDNFENATPDFQLSRRNISGLRAYLESGKTVCFAGFLGTTHDGLETLLGRGGSDQSAVFLSCLLRDHYDVETMLLKETPVESADPLIVKDQARQRIPIMTYNEASKATMLGMKIVQNAAVRLASSCGLPIIVAPLHDLELKTVIQAQDPTSQIVKCVTGVRNCAIITMSNDKSRSLEDCLRLWEGYDGFLDLGAEVIDTGQVLRDFLILDGDFVRTHEEQLRAFDKDMRVEYDLGVVALIGDRMRSSAGVASMAIRALPNINIKRGIFAPHTSQIILVVSGEDVSETVRAIHHQVNKIYENSILQ